jgi:Flp pilus assembly protein TadG
MLRRNEDGSVVMMVAICLFVLLGMLVLTFDLGRIVAVRRDMVNASDAAALAAAQACAQQRDYDVANAAAATLVGENSKNLSETTMDDLDAPQCETLDGTLKYASVHAQTTVNYYFAQIFGFDDGPVGTTATAAWGPAIGVANPVPLRLLNASVLSCIEVAPGVPRPVGYAGPECAFGFDNTSQNSHSSSQWGILDFPEGWPTGPPNPMECNSQAGGSNDVIDYLGGVVGDFFPVMWTNPVYVCAEGGLSANVMNWIIDWLIANIGEDLIFPVMADPAQFPPVLTSGSEAYPIRGFVSLRVMGAWKGREARNHCEFQANNASLFCLQLAYNGVQVEGGIPGNGVYYNIQAFRLVE